MQQQYELNLNVETKGGGYPAEAYPRIRADCGRQDQPPGACVQAQPGTNRPLLLLDGDTPEAFR